jgi:hypothetical protein
MRSSYLQFGALVSLALAGGCNTPEAAVDDGSDEEGMVDLGTIDDLSADALVLPLTTASTKKKCPANSTDPGCVKGRSAVNTFAQLDRSIFAVRCDQTPAGETTTVAFNILDPVTVLRERATGQGDPVNVSTIAIVDVDKAGHNHTIEGVTESIYLDGKKVATITADNKQHVKAKVDRTLAGAAAVLAVVTSPAFVIDRIKNASQLCPNNTVIPPHPDIFTKDHGCALCRVGKGLMLGGVSALTALVFPGALVGLGVGEAFAAGFGAAAAAGADAIIVEGSCDSQCQISECYDKAEDCLRFSSPAEGRVCEHEFSRCCMGAGGQCESGQVGDACISCRDPDFF